MTQVDNRATDTSVPDVLPEWVDSHMPGVFARGFHSLDPMFAEVSACVLAAAAIQPGQTVIDIAPGAGIPTFRVARRVGSVGRVVAVDPAPVCVAAVRNNAGALGFANVEAIQASAATLPFAPATFDAATCQFGVMFFPDVQAGLTRIRSVLRPGGRAAFAAWGPREENTLFGTTLGVQARYLPPPPMEGDPVDIPFPMRFAQAGTLGAALERAGFEDVREDAPKVTLTWPGSPETMREFTLDMTNAREQLEPDAYEVFAADLLAALELARADDTLRFTARVVIASGRNPA